MFACSTISLGTKKRIDLSLIEGSNVNSINNYLEQRNIIINKNQLKWIKLYNRRLLFPVEWQTCQKQPRAWHLNTGSEMKFASKWMSGNGTTAAMALTVGGIGFKYVSHHMNTSIKLLYCFGFGSVKKFSVQLQPFAWMKRHSKTTQLNSWLLD